MKISAGGKTDVGKVRQSNEDGMLFDVDLGLFAVADGMGGHNAGEVASRIALETLHAHVKKRSSDLSLAQTLREAVNAASNAIAAEAAADRSKDRMGTTLTTLLIDGKSAALAHVGDSRLYQVRWGRVEKLTEDHTAVAELVKAGAITEADAPKHPWAHILSRVVGKGDVEVQTAELSVEAGDRFLLCSDGFSDSLTDPSWLTAIVQQTPNVSAEMLVTRAIELDGTDNATAVVVAIGDTEVRQERASLWKRFRNLVTMSHKRIG